MKLSVRTKILVFNISITFLILLLLFFVTLNAFQQSILDMVTKKLIQYSQDSQIYFMNSIKDYSYPEMFFKFRELAPFISNYIYQKYGIRVQIYDSRKNLITDSYRGENYYVYQDIHYAVNGMKNYIIKKFNGESFLFLSSPIFFKTETVGAIRFIYPLNKEFKLINKIKWNLIFIGSIAIVLIVLVNIFFSYSIVKPIKLLRNATEKLTQGKFDMDIKIDSNDEIEDLAKSYKIMAESLKSYIDSLKEEKEKQKKFTDNVTHELKTPISIILGHAELLTKLKSDEAKKKSIDHISTEAKRLLKLVEGLLYLSKLNRPSFEFEYKKVNIKDVVYEVVELLKPRFVKFSIEIEIDLKGEILIIDPERIKEVLLNILDNAIKHSKCTKIKIYDFKKKNRYVLAIEDNGVGIKEEIKKHLFTPLSSIRGKRSYGLGLSIVNTIMKKHEGYVEVSTERGKGTTIYLYFRIK